jgi:uncharacterized protein (TIGR02145 family)
LSPLQKVHFLYLYHNMNLQYFKIQLVASSPFQGSGGIGLFGVDSNLKLHTMKKLFTILVAALLTATLWAQSPEKISYQAVIRNAADNLVTNTNVGMRIQILQTSEFGAAVYVETHSPTTNANGLVSLEIGAGTVVSGDLKTIDWSKGPYFIKTETDPAGGKNYNITATSQLLSVPYSLHAKTADNGITPAQANAIVANTAKTGITTAQANAIVANTAKTGITTAQANAIVANTAKVSAATGTKTGDMQFWDGSEWIIVAAGKEGQVLTFNDGVPTWITEVGDNFVINFTTGKIWMDRNLGASRVATSSNDTNAYGDLYQWGRGTDGHEKRTSNTTSTVAISDNPGHDNFITNNSSPYDWRNPQNNNLWQGVSGTNNPCPSGYRLPTDAEWEEERTSWISDNAAGAFASRLKLTVAGYREFSSGSISYEDTLGHYWSSTVAGTSSRDLNFGFFSSNLSSSIRLYGKSVRCIKE